MPEWVVHLLRILLAIALGFAIGIERKMRFKEAGMRTHAVVAAGACVFMLISKYGFSDVPNYDGSRIASQVVSGIGFIGAGMILYRKQAVHGLTTAAGVWVTAGIGMAAGAGMYIVAAGATVLIIVIQCIMHINCRLFRVERYMQIRVTFVNNADESETVKRLFEVSRYLEVVADRKDDDIIFKVLLRTEKMFDDTFIRQTLKDYPFIIDIERVDDEG